MDRARTQERWREIASTVSMLVLAPLCAIVLITFVFQSYEVDGMSMEATLQDRDRLIVWKAPQTWAQATHRDFVPHRHAIVVLTKHEFPGSGQDKKIIKRVMGLPGERVVVEDGKVTIYNQEYPEGFDPDAGKVAFTPGSVDVVVPAHEVFVLGDNRTNSLDSPDFGTVPVKDIVGEAALRIFPFNSLKNL